ncbi:protein kinase [Streptomyces uncialis]|uniref:serine/threonine-protein kinase n=1 Tax=Streptomyces uncialis TaxID=1048205 RepID=UPI0037A0AD55
MTGERIGDYTVERRLGSGGMGAVYLGRSPSGRAVAIKVVRPEYAADPEFRARFRTEVEAARRVGGFHTAAVVDADPDAERPWMASAYIKGPTLSEAVARHGPMDDRALRALGAGLAEALKAIHACGLVHRDLKPGNIVLTDDGPRVLDFGIAYALEGSQLTAPGVVVGTPGFTAPEQLVTGERVHGACDVFALGAVLVAASGGSAFGVGQALALAYRVVAEEPDVSAVPGALRPAVRACLHRNPDRRPSPARLLEVFTATGPDAPRTAPPHRSEFPAPAPDFPDSPPGPAPDSLCSTPGPAPEGGYAALPLPGAAPLPSGPGDAAPVAPLQGAAPVPPPSGPPSPGGLRSPTRVDGPPPPRPRGPDRELVADAPTAAASTTDTPAGAPRAAPVPPPPAVPPRPTPPPGRGRAHRPVTPPKPRAAPRHAAPATGHGVPPSPGRFRGRPGRRIFLPVAAVPVVTGVALSGSPTAFFDIIFVTPFVALVPLVLALVQYFRSHGLDIAADGVTLIVADSVSRWHWDDIDSLELVSRNAGDWLVVRPAEGRHTPRFPVWLGWIRRAGDRSMWIRLDGLRPRDGTRTLAETLAAHADQQNVRLTLTRTPAH